MNHRRAPALTNYVETIRHLIPGQILSRIKTLASRRATLLRGKEAHLGLLRKSQRLHAGEFAGDDALRDRLVQLAYWKMKTKRNIWNPAQPADWRILNQQLRIGFPPRWNARVIYSTARDPRLWHFHLHYFEWIWDLLQSGRNLLAVRVMENWAWGNRLGSRGCFLAAWSPYTASLRMRAWCTALALLLRRKKISNESLRVLGDSLWAQAVYLRDHLETEHGGNHLLENLIALSFVARCFAGNDARRIARESDRMLKRELAHQISENGCHCEQSPMYQVILLDHLSDLLSILAPADPARAWIHDHVSRMNKFLCHLLKPDGNHPLLGDSTRSADAKLWATRARVSEVLGEKLCSPARGFSEMDGYYVYRDMKAGDYILFDSAPLGEDSLGAHMHCDILGFEVVLGDVPIIADGGAGIYREGLERTHLRGPLEHAGLVVDGWACAEPWKSFRMGRRGKIMKREGGETEDGFKAHATHDGFSPASANHSRAVEFDTRNKALTVRDQLLPTAARASWPVEMRLPLHHAVVARRSTPRSWEILTRSGTKVAEISVQSAQRSLQCGEESGIYYAAFGIALKRTVLKVSCIMSSGDELVYTVKRSP